MVRLDAALAERWAGIALANVARPYPYRLDQLLNAAQDLAEPSTIHPAFWGSYDWHSCVHMHWTLVRLLRRFPDHAHALATRRQFAGRLTSVAIAGELRSLARPGHGTFERPYGWGWLLKLAAELHLLAAEQPCWTISRESIIRTAPECTRTPRSRCCLRSTMRTSCSTGRCRP
jgi:hypothetical protein